MRARITLLIITLLTVCQMATAQVGDRRNDVAIGVNVGINMSSIGFTPTIKQGSLMGNNFGVTLKYTCEKYFKTLASLQMEINYSQQGWVEDIEDGSENTYQRSVDYIQVPFMAHLAWGREGRGAQFYFNAGPQIAFYLSDQETYGGEEWDITWRPNGVIEQYGKEIECTFDYGICGGVGVELNTMLGHFLLEGRYYYGFGNLFNNTKRDPFGNSNNSVVTLKFTYLFDIAHTK